MIGLTSLLITLPIVIICSYGARKAYDIYYACCARKKPLREYTRDDIVRAAMNKYGLDENQVEIIVRYNIEYCQHLPFNSVIFKGRARQGRSALMSSTKLVPQGRASVVRQFSTNLNALRIAHCTYPTVYRGYFIAARADIYFMIRGTTERPCGPSIFIHYSMIARDIPQEFVRDEKLRPFIRGDFIELSDLRSFAVAELGCQSQLANQLNDVNTMHDDMI